MKRESRTIRLAIDALGISGAEAFLNGVDNTSGVRPLTTAANSAEGARSVEQAIDALRSVDQAVVVVHTLAPDGVSENPDRGRS